MKHRLASHTIVAVLCGCCAQVCGQNYPAKPVRILTGEAGGTNDLVARVLAQGTAAGLGQNVIVDNRPSGLLGDVAAKGAPDGYTLAVAGSTFMLGPLLQKVSYDPVKDFAPITLTIRQPIVLVGHPTLPAKSVKDLIALARLHPGALNYASTGTGGIFHLAAELLKSMAAVNIVRVPYKGTSQALTDTISGQVQIMFVSPGGAGPHVKSGKLRALGITSARPSIVYPGLPTIAETGLPGYEAVTVIGVFAPAKTPTAIIARLNQEMVQVLNQSAVKDKFLSAGAETIPGTPEQLASTLQSELAKWGKLIKSTGISAE